MELGALTGNLGDKKENKERVENKEIADIQVG